MPAENITNKIIVSYLDSLYRGRSKALEDLRAFAEESHVPVIARDTEKLLSAVLKLRKPSSILEIGTAVGYSACFFAECCDGRIVTIEADHEAYCSALKNVQSLGFADRISLIEGSATEVLKEMQSSNENCPPAAFDLVFIDAAKSHYREFWDLSLPLCCDDGIIICDNVLMKGMTASDDFDVRGRYKTSIRKMREFVKYINEAEYAETTVLPVGDGVSVSIIDKSLFTE